MKPVRIVIIEDEKPAARLLERKIEKFGYQVLEKLTSVEDAVHWFQQNEEPDLIFLDIQLSDGLSFEIFDQVEVKSAIIFTTAYDAYALRAFKLNSIDYLLKPIADADLKGAIDKFNEQRASFFAFTEQLNLFKSFLSTTPKENKERFLIKIGTQLKIVPIGEIACFFSANKLTYLKTKEGREYILDNSLDEVEKTIEAEQFFRISRKHIVALDGIKDIVAYSNSRLKLNLHVDFEEDLIVSREKVNDFKLWLS
ncbi:LytTR family DNA-binding domain-containing protein [Myroides sp. DF42-4-2]|uniref:LytR/AlgR family response regulator transcription factor n=1 Tax=unclassified Myroides TaxID=2642485 RepID=UPI0025787DEB|nr:LytTR family DNA-binding domain-containing protein [Myroides sp. DF42-4-2]MDM1407534.1 response regulator transcription factor [Myroides sp. DF42-4-2]